MRVIGITGPTGAGKTTLLRQVERLGGAVIDCDAVYHGLLEGERALQHELEERFGPLRGEDGGFRRKMLGNIVFHDPAALADLNHITRPYILRAVEAALQKARQAGLCAAAVDAFALLGSGLDRMCDVTVAVTAPAEVRVRRIMAREGIPEEYARARVAAQPDEAYYRQHCTFCIVNDCSDVRDFDRRAEELLRNLIFGPLKKEVIV